MRGRCASTSSQRRATGLTSSISTGCGSTRRRASTIARRSTSSPTIARQRARGAPRHAAIVLVAENEPQHVAPGSPARRGGFGLDALWNDDFHHSALVALTGRREAYYTDHRGTPQEFISAAKYGYLFQGQRYAWQKKRRGTPSRGLPPPAFVNFIENHDQVANSGDGSRLHALPRPGRYRAMTALLLLMPGTPMLFQGQEFGARHRSSIFADHKPELAAAVARGRARVRLRSSRACDRARCRQQLPSPRRPGRSSAASSIGASARRTPRADGCTAI